MKIIVCIGSSCHIKGSRQIIELIKKLITENKMEDQIELAGTFCMGNCKDGVCIKVDDEQFSLSPEKTMTFFETQVLTKIV